MRLPVLQICTGICRRSTCTFTQGRRYNKSLEEFYPLKDGFAIPSRYLGAEIKRCTFPNDATDEKWAMSSTQYVKEAIQNNKQHLKKLDRKFYMANQPMHSDYAPELDVTLLLNNEEINFYQSQISILRWMVELGRLDIYVQVSMLSSYLVQQRQWHMEAVYHLYGYLKSHDKSTMVFDTKYVNWNDDNFPEYDWSEFYRDAREDQPSNSSLPRGMPVQINMFVDASHARNKIT
jgi:hypothetical protein